MKRIEAIEKLNEWLLTYNTTTDIIDAKALLTFVEQCLGMKPPELPEDYCQAIMSVYYGGVSFNQWEENLQFDSKVMEAYNRRLARKELKKCAK